MVTLDGVDAHAHRRRPADLRRRPACRKASPGSWAAPRPRSSDDTTEILLESAYFEPIGHRPHRQAARTAFRGERPLRARHRPERHREPARCARWSCSPKSRRAQPAAGAIDVYPAPIERPRITVRTARVNALLGTELDATAMQRAVAHRSASRPRGPAPTSSPSRRRSAPTSNARSTSSRKSARRVGLQNIPRTVPSNPEKIGSLTPEQRERRAIADVLVGAGYDEAYTLPLLAPADLDARRHRRVRRRRGREPAARRGVDPASRVCCPACCARRRSMRRTERRTSRCSSSAPCSRRPHRANRCRASRCTCAMVRTGSVRRAPHEPDRPVDRRRRGRGRRGARRRAAARRLATGSRRRRARLPPDAHGGRDRRRASASGVVGEVAAACVAALDLAVPVVVCELDVGRARRRSAAATPRVARLAVPGVVDRSRVRRRRHRAGGGRARDAARRRPARSAEQVELFDVFRSETPRAGPGQPRVHVLVPGSGPHAHRRRGRRACGKPLIDAVVAAHGAELRERDARAPSG